MRNKKGQVLSNLGGLAIGIATLMLVLVVAFLVMAQAKTQDADVTGIVCNNSFGSAGCNATKELQGATDDIPGWVPLIVVVVIGGAIIGMVSKFGR